MASLEEIRAALKTARKGRGLTLDGLAETSGLDRMTIHKIENLKGAPTYEPGIDTVRKLVEGLGLSLADFFAELEDKPRQPDQRTAADLFTQAFRVMLQTTPTAQEEMQEVQAFLALERRVRRQILRMPPLPTASRGTTPAIQEASRTKSPPSPRRRVRDSKGSA